jgi:mono/diheme cytochrome c family protein
MILIRSLPALLLTGLATVAQAQTSTEFAPGRAYFSPTEKFTPRSGEEIYATVCQACHMPAGKGATGAGAYPSFVRNPKLASSQYVAYMVVNGRKAMPPFGNALDDEQVANVVNYLRTHFDNGYTDAVTPADVKTARPVPTASR